MSLPMVGGVRLSPQQRRLWALFQDGSACRAACALSVEGPLDEAALGGALRDLVERHEILRTAYRCLEGMTIPLQLIAEPGEVRLERVDLTAAAPEARAAAVERLLWSDGDGALGADDPPLHVALASLDRDRWLLPIRVPALGADAAGLRLLARDLVRLYAVRRGEVGGPVEEAAQYADLAEWLNEILDGEDGEEGRSYWRRSQIEDLLPVVLPESRGARGPFRPALVAGSASPSRATALAAAAAALAAEPAEVLLACWLTFIGIRTGRSAALSGVLLEGRDYAELETTIGPLDRVVPLRADTGPEVRFPELVAQVRQLLAGARSWQECFSWDLLTVGGASPDGEPRLPFLFAHADAEVALTAAGVRFAVERLTVCGERFDLKLLSSRRGDALVLDVEHDADRLSLAAARHLLARFEDLLDAVLRDPQTVLGRLVSLGAVERHRLVHELNDTSRAACSPQGAVHRRFERAAAATPGRPAVRFEESVITYGELDALANRLAGHLARWGVGPGDVVPICLERSLDMVASLLAVLKTGAAYAPLDPSQPGARLAAMMSDLSPRVVLTEERWLGLLPQRGMRLICLDRDGEAIHREEARRSSPEVAGEHLAYVIFTSGSTGRPKAVGVEHRQLASYVDAILRRLDLPQDARFGMVSTFAADLGHTVLFPALASGGCLDVVSLERVSDPQALAEHFGRHPVDCLKIVPGHLRALLAAAQPERILPRRRLVLGGEASARELLQQVRALAPGCVVINHYGPTEITVGALVSAVGEEGVESATVPIGRPLDNSAAYLLDRALRPVPAGVAGEIFIGGRGVARGYLGEPAATAERFLPDPFSGEPGGRLYRTGDLACHLTSGSVEFLGRVDHQVKIRGFRIEPGEIEAVMARHPAVRQALIVAQPDGAGDTRLVAYLVFDSPRPTLQELRDHAARSLPDFMVPALYVPLDAMPLTANGKVDRRALPDPGRESLRLAGERMPPRTRAEKILAAVWCEVLGLEEVGVCDNFFDLGGDSILSIKIVARAHQEGLRLVPRQLFEHQTIASLAEAADTVPLAEVDQGVVVGPVPLTPIQHLFFEQELAEPWHWNQSLLFEVRRMLDAARLEKVVGRLVEHHDALRLRLVRTEVGWVQHNAPPDGAAPLTRIDLSSLPEGEWARALERAAAQVQTSLDLAAGPLLRVVLFHPGHSAHDRLLLVVHHLAVDGVSWRILLEDLETGYEQLVRRGRLTLPPKTTSFKSWAERLFEHSWSPEALGELEHWLRQPFDQILRIPVDRSGAAGTIASLRSVAVSLGVEETRALLQEAPSAYHTRIEELLLTALARAARIWCGESALLVDLEGHGREDLFEAVDLSRTIGWFTTVYPVILGPVLGADPGVDVKKVKEQLRAVPGHGIHYGLLRFLSPDAELRARLRALPGAEVRFNYLGQLDRVLPADSLFATAPEHKGDERSPSSPLQYRLDLVSWVAGGRLQMSWGFSGKLFQDRTVEEMAAVYLRELRAVLDHCRAIEVGAFTPSDFPDAGLTQEGLDRLLEHLGDVGEI